MSSCIHFLCACYMHIYTYMHVTRLINTYIPAGYASSSKLGQGSSTDASPAHIFRTCDYIFVTQIDRHTHIYVYTCI